MCQVCCTPGGLWASSCAPLTNCIFLPLVSQIHCTYFFYLSPVLSTPLIWCIFYLLCVNKGTANDEHWEEDMILFNKHLLVYVFPVTLSGFWLRMLRLKLQTSSLFSYCNDPSSILELLRLAPKSPGQGEVKLSSHFINRSSEFDYVCWCIVVLWKEVRGAENKYFFF